MSMPRFYIGKHPCDDLPYVHDVDPDPRSGDPHFSFDGPDYSGWYVLSTDRQWFCRDVDQKIHWPSKKPCPHPGGRWVWVSDPGVPQ